MPASSRVSRLDESGEARPHAGRKSRLAAEQAALAVDRQHDDDRVGAREMLRRAGRAIAPPTGVDDAGRLAAMGAKTMPRVPMQQRLRLGDRRLVLGRDEALGCDRTQVGDEERFVRLQGLGGTRLDRDAETGGPIDHAQKDRFARRPKPSGLGKIEQRIEAVRIRFEHCTEKDLDEVVSHVVVHW